jgi:hypothetical protein
MRFCSFEPKFLNSFRHFGRFNFALILHEQALLGGATDTQSAGELMSAIRSLTGKKIRVKVRQHFVSKEFYLWKTRT